MAEGWGRISSDNRIEDIVMSSWDSEKRLEWEGLTEREREERDEGRNTGRDA